MLEIQEKYHKDLYSEDYLLNIKESSSSSPNIREFNNSPPYAKWIIDEVKNCSGFNYIVLTLTRPDYTQYKDKPQGTYRFLYLDRNKIDEIFFYEQGINDDDPSCIVFPASKIRVLFKPTLKQKKQIRKCLKNAYCNGDFPIQMGCKTIPIFWQLWYFLKHHYYSSKFPFWIISSTVMLSLGCLLGQIVK